MTDEIRAFVEQTEAVCNEVIEDEKLNVRAAFQMFTVDMPRALEIIKAQAARIEELERGKNNG